MERGFLEKPGNVFRTIPQNVRCRIFETLIGPEFFFFTVIRKKLRQLIFAKIFREATFWRQFCPFVLRAAFTTATFLICISQV